ncbi:hypothetical protein GCM10011571_03590 [Marinithermofilum abyssi]|uniref:histidine kinase n=1 Tax=Marinithermofilum abyssi TaxID=1571185 RepID=A0A8J2VE57_9BACL|nr:ATP-binding protein [Marinithermofilum abyssi]GGE05750.1 hypothetical protein GCM10011571_03590 [Marinithermofilum abyssi]
MSDGLSTWLGEGMIAASAARWVIFVLALTLLNGLLMMKKRWLRKMPGLLYGLLVLASCSALDYSADSIEFIWVYITALGLVNIRLPKYYVPVHGFLFYGGYLLMEILDHRQMESVWTWLAEGAAFGLITWFSCHSKMALARVDQLKEENRRLLKKVSDAQERLYEYIEELEETSRRDVLTGLYNFSGFQEQVSKSLSRCTGGQCYHVVCIDLVDFQQVNMREGTDGGDQLLIKIAQQLKKKLPHYTQIARYDGDQFAVGLIGDERALRGMLETIEHVINGLQPQRTIVNYCTGTATYPNEANHAPELIQLAEQRLSIEQRRIRDQEDERRRHLEKLSAVGQLAAGLAHEIRNPLTSIRGFIQISASESLEVKKWESIILPEIDRINDLLKQFLHLSESRPARFMLFNLDRLIDDVLQLLRPKSILMGQELTAIPPEDAVIIEADAEQLKQVLINLVQNGLEALQGKGEVRVSWKQLQDRISIRVEDNGSGIQPEHMSRIFDPFFTTKGDGTGMGLSICHRIISDHGGQVHVTSQPGRGTVFSLHLPVRQSNPSISSLKKDHMREISREIFVEDRYMMKSR